MARRTLLILRVAVLAIAAATAGCRVPQRIPPVVVGPFDEAPSLGAFERILATVRAAGYEPSAIDAERGMFRVRSMSTTRPGEHGFLVQCFADGLLQLVPVGPAVTREANVFVLPATLRAEMVALAHVLSSTRRAP